MFPSIHYQSTGAPSTNRQLSSTVLTSFLLSLSQNALTIITVIRNVTAPLAKIIANATEVIAVTGTGKETGTVAGERETTASVSLTVIGNARIAVTAVKGIANGNGNAVVIAKKDARATRRNADGSTRAKMTDVGHSAPARRKEAPLAVPVAAVVVNVTVAHQIAARPHL